MSSRHFGTSASRRLAGNLGIAAIVSVGCGASRSNAPAVDYAGPLDFPSGSPADFFDRQHIVASYGGHSFGFDAVLQKRGEELTLLGLTPFGTRAFVVIQRGADISSQSYVGQSLPFPPRDMLIDVHRVFFQPDPGPAGFDGARTFSRAGEVVTEEWRGGRLVRRSFVREDGRPPGTIVVDYDAGPPGPPARVVLSNGWYGYRLEIRTLRHTPLELKRGPE